MITGLQRPHPDAEEAKLGRTIGYTYQEAGETIEDFCNRIQPEIFSDLRLAMDGEEDD